MSVAYSGCISRGAGTLPCRICSGVTPGPYTVAFLAASTDRLPAQALRSSSGPLTWLMPTGLGGVEQAGGGVSRLGAATARKYTPPAPPPLTRLDVGLGGHRDEVGFVLQPAAAQASLQARHRAPAPLVQRQPRVGAHAGGEGARALEAQRQANAGQAARWVGRGGAGLKCPELAAPLPAAAAADCCSEGTPPPTGQHRQRA